MADSNDEWFLERMAEEAARRAQLRRHRLADWQERYLALIYASGGAWGIDHDHPSALARGWEEILSEWSSLHPEIIPATICAGCRQALGTGPVITLDLGYQEAPGHYRVHDDGRYFCLDAFHEHRRVTARRALAELGLKPLTRRQFRSFLPELEEKYG